jgi:cytoskeletal protein CcmA (bactofilin family)
MAGARANTIIAEDMVIRGDITNGGLVEVKGYVEGSVSADRLLIHESGRVYGTVRADNCDVNGRLQGKVFIKHLISIGNSGAVTGDVRYGQLALAGGGDLDANVRNVPPEIAGDLNVTVQRGHAVRITTTDLSAIDPDSAAASVVFSVAGVSGGHVAKTQAPKIPVTTFTQEDLEAGHVSFIHDGSAGASAAVELVAADQTGATSGAPKTLSVTVFDR